MTTPRFFHVHYRLMAQPPAALGGGTKMACALIVYDADPPERSTLDAGRVTCRACSIYLQRQAARIGGW